MTTPDQCVPGVVFIFETGIFVGVGLLTPAGCGAVTLACCSSGGFVVTDLLVLPGVDSVLGAERAAAMARAGNVDYGLIFGKADTVEIASTPEDVWDGTGLYTGFASAAETVSIVSSDTTDTAAGVGARTVQVTGLDANYAEVSETFTLLGTLTVTGTQAFLRVNSVKVLTAGSSGTNVGVLTVTQSTTTTNVFAKVVAGTGASRVAAFTVPAGKQLLVTHLEFMLARTGGAAGSGTMSLLCRESGAAWLTAAMSVLTSYAMAKFDLAGGLLFPEKTDLRATVEIVSSNGTAASTMIEYLIFDK